MTELFDPEYTSDAKKHNDCSHQLKDGEVWVANTSSVDAIPPHLKSLKTVRIGEQAYDIKGKPIERWYCRPLIVHKSEMDLYNSIMMAKQNDGKV